MEGDFIKINKWLLPLSWLYGLGVKFRNLMFSTGVLKSRAFDVPVISVGNITVGGTGKTPHVEYLIRLLQDMCHVAVLSRGYKRQSKGFVKATTETPMQEIGDEPYQMKQKFPHVTVAVDADRCHGIDTLMDDVVKPDVILLDDAFQHRYVKPGINILLVDYHRLIIYDELLPAGRLREPLNGKDRADIVIVTKCPKELKPMEYRVITKAMNLYPFQQLFFTTLEYGDLKPVFPEAAKVSGVSGLSELKDQHILVLTGIASPEQLMHDLSPLTTHLTPLSFADHHEFNAKDVQLINDTFATLPSPRIIITTEKDACRLQQTEGLSDQVRANLFVLPIHVCFMLKQDETFNTYIINYVHKNSRNSILVKTKDDNKSQDGDRAGNRPRTISFRDY
jgi:tetraacyldisaccharide 4'-kinase